MIVPFEVESTHRTATHARIHRRPLCSARMRHPAVSRRASCCSVAHAAIWPSLPLRSATTSEQQSTSAPGLPLTWPPVRESSLVEGVVLLRLARMGKKRWRALARPVPLGSCGYESLDGVDGDGSHASYRVGLEGGDRRYVLAHRVAADDFHRELAHSPRLIGEGRAESSLVPGLPQAARGPDTLPQVGARARPAGQDPMGWWTAESDDPRVVNSVRVALQHGDASVDYSIARASSGLQLDALPRGESPDRSRRHRAKSYPGARGGDPVTIRAATG